MTPSPPDPPAAGHPAAPAPPGGERAARLLRPAVPMLAACALVAVVAVPLPFLDGANPAGWALAVLADLLVAAAAAGAWWTYRGHGTALDAAAHYRAQAEAQAAALHRFQQEQARREQAWQAHAADLAARNEAVVAAMERLLSTQLPAALHGRDVPPAEVPDESLDPGLAKLRATVLDAAAEVRRDHADVLESQQLTLVALARRVQSAMHRVQAEAATAAERFRDLPELYVTCQVIDHLAAQSARLAQGLAVACGTWEGQQWDAPMRLAEVVQAAQARIEDYRRVGIEGDPDTAIAPVALESVIHVLAELLANATESSPTATPVTVRVTTAAQGAVFRIDDHGAGLEEPRMSQARAVLDGTRTVTLADMGEVPRMGFPVVARYVRRHRLKVTLDESPYGGLQAVVLVPRDLVTVAPAPAFPSHSSVPAPDLVPPAPAPAPARFPEPEPEPGPGPGGGGGEGRGLPQRVSRRNRSVPPPPSAPPMTAPSPETPQEAGELMGALFEGAAAVPHPPPAPAPDDRDDDANRTGDEGR
ncbi:ATP-binding protein [Spirillospora sp. CA-255316]